VVKETPNGDEPKTLGDRLNGLRWRLLATVRVWRPGASPDLPMIEPPPVEPAPEGSLDLPAEGPVLRRGPIALHGWSLFPSGPTAKVEVWLGEEPLGRARIGVPRPDVSSSLGLSPSEAPGFELTANLLGWPGEDGETELRAVATSFAGERLEIEPLPLRVAGAAIRGPTSPAPEHTPAAAHKPGLRTMVVAHQLDRGGAQLYLMDLLRALMRIEAVNPTVVASRDGPLRAELEELGVPVHVCGVAPAEGLSAHLGRVEELASWAADREFEVAFVNTGTSLVIPGVEVAGRLGIPAVWAIHESYEPSRLWDDLAAPVRERAERALAEVAQPLFVAEATQRLFEPLNRRALTIPYGLDLEPIDSRRDGFDRDGAREAAGIPLDAEVVLCVGSVEPRKAQVPLAQAFDRIAVRHPRARLLFVGAGDGGYSDFLARYAAASAAAERISIVPMTTDVQPWYGISDLVACPSDVESMPRTTLEAMAWEVPVLATNVFGLPELIEDGESGWLFEPRDLTALTAALERALASTPEERRRIGRSGRALVEQRHSLEAYGREIGALLEQVAGGDRGEPLVDAAAR
jgi:glycosyltransferase involved in cell wall biosynthesis